jgi:glutamine synthetase
MSNNIKVEYIWIGGNKELRSKTKIIKSEFPLKLEDLPIWNYDGSSTEQASGHNSEVLIKPCRIYKDPYSTRVNDIFCICDTFFPNNHQHNTNTRFVAEQIFKNKPELEPMFGIEQEFFAIHLETQKPIGFPFIGLPNPQGQYYCSVGAENAFGRDFFEEAETMCLDAGISLTGKNYEVCPGQMEMQVCNIGIAAADDIIMLRYILAKTGEKYNIKIDISPKPVKGDWNGSGCHVNFSTKPMRDENGYDIIIDAIQKLKEKHSEHIELYGDGNAERLTGLHETSDISKFSFGVADRSASIRIPRETEQNNCGYFEDRRPSSNCDPYLVTSKIFETCCL